MASVTADLILPGDASPTDVLSAKTFSAGTNYDKPGTMADNGALSYGPSTSSQAIPAGYTSGGTISAVGGTATAADVLSGATFSSGNGIGLSGSMPNNGSPTLTMEASPISLSSGWYSGGTVNPTIAIFTADGSGTIPSGVTSIRVIVVGAGGGAGSSYTGNGGGSGGGAGATVAGNLAVSAGQTFSVTVGAGGAGGSGDHVNGTSGTATTFTLGSNTLGANGGTLGYSYAAAGSGGSVPGPAGSWTNILEDIGGNGIQYSNLSGGPGGASNLAAGGAAPSSSGSTAAAGTAGTYGAGGGGASASTTASANGGAGANGLCIVIFG